MGVECVTRRSSGGYVFVLKDTRPGWRLAASGLVVWGIVLLAL